MTVATLDAPSSQHLPGEDGELLPTYKPEPLAATLDRMAAFNRRYVHHKLDSTHDLMTVWVASTYAMPVWDWHGRIYITAPQPGCGKSTQAEVAAFLCGDSVETASVSGSGLFREISARQPVVFLDEAENQWSAAGGRDKEILTAVVNRGYRPGGYVIRTERNVAVRHPVYAAVCIIGVDNGLLPDTTRSRCIPVRMVPGDSRPQRFRPRDHEDFASEVRWRLSEHAFAWQVIDSGLAMRDGDLWEALFSVASAAGGDWPERIRKAHAEHGWDSDVCEAGLLLRAVQRYFAETKAEHVSAAALAAYLSGDDALPAITPKGLHKVMGGYGVRPVKSHGVSTYRKDSLADAFTTWL